MKAIDAMRTHISNLRYQGLTQVAMVDVEKCLDAIERELEERYVERPIDADGVTIAPSDNMIDQKGEQFVVSSIELLASGEWLVYGNGNLGNEFAKLCHHHKPPTVEDVLREFALACEDAGNAGPEVERIASEFAERLQLKERDDD